MSVYFDPVSDKYLPIPDSPYYVCSNDTFMSRNYPKNGKINTVVVPCNNLTEARKVVDYIATRIDQAFVRIVRRKPRKKKHVIYSLCKGWLKNAGCSKVFAQKRS